MLPEVSHQLPADWKPPERALVERAWARHPRRRLLDQLKRERDAAGNPTWRLVLQDTPEDPEWTRATFEPIDPLDLREGVRITSWPTAKVQQLLDEARAIADEGADGESGRPV